MFHNDPQFQIFLSQVERSGRFPKAILEPPEHGENIATISGEVQSKQDHIDIVEMARQHGYHLLARKLFIPIEA
jgi:hypothetical protein